MMDSLLIYLCQTLTVIIRSLPVYCVYYFFGFDIAILYAIVYAAYIIEL